MIPAFLPLLIGLIGFFGHDTANEHQAPAVVQLERISTAVPWPRGLVFTDGKLFALARGRHRRAGGPDPAIEDMAGALFTVDPSISEPVVIGVKAGDAIRANGEVYALPTSPPFRPWDRRLVPAKKDTTMDRPYCTLVWDPTSQNFFICGFSGADNSDGTFRKNATDSVLRFDTRDRSWNVVDVHNPDVVPVDTLSNWAPSRYYPHHDPETHTPPHGWLNGPNGATAVGESLYVVAKDNSLMVRYDLAEIESDPAAPPPEGVPVLGSEATVRIKGTPQTMRIEGHSALAASDDYLYVGFRTTSQVVRFPLHEDGTLVQPLVGDLIALFEPYDPSTRLSADLIDMAFNNRGELFVSTGERGGIWNLGFPDPQRVFDGREGKGTQPVIDVPALSGKPKARVGNLCFDDEDRLYFCSGNYDASSNLAGVIYRVDLGD